MSLKFRLFGFLSQNILSRKHDVGILFTQAGKFSIGCVVVAYMQSRESLIFDRYSTKFQFVNIVYGRGENGITVTEPNVIPRQSLHVECAWFQEYVAQSRNGPSIKRASSYTILLNVHVIIPLSTHVRQVAYKTHDVWKQECCQLSTRAMPTVSLQPPARPRPPQTPRTPDDVAAFGALTF